MLRDGLNSDAPYFAPFVLDVNFRDRGIDSSSISIPASVLANDDVADEFSFSGNYDGHGLIRGTVSYNKIATAGGAGTSVAGHLSGLIGEDGAVGGFISNTFASATDAYTGGFVARPPEAVTITRKVIYADWVNSFDTPPPNQLDTSARHNQFLGTVAGATELDEFGFVVGTTIQKGRLDLDDSSTNFTFVGDAEDGVSFFWDNWASSGYSGILSSTDLGAPVTQGVGPAKVTWKGHFHALIRPVNSDFVLEIDFNNNGKKTIEAFVQEASDNYYHLKGEFDDNGVIINGTVNYGTFSDTAMRTPTGDRAPNGFLTGLIGVDGAVGAFLSGVNTSTKEAIRADTPAVHYAGGFVASPTVVNHLGYTDWTGSFTTTLTDTMLDMDTRASQFLATASAATALDETGVGTSNAANKGSLTLANATFKGAGLGGQATDGVSWFWDSDNNFGYAGILSSTDLGVPLTQTSGTAIWNGSFQTTGDVTINDDPARTYNSRSGTRKVNTNINRDFLLEIDFGNSNTIEAFIYHTGANYYHLTGNFVGGVITGKVNYGTFSDLTARTTAREPNGILTGLIGAQGAVGAFISGTGTKNAITASDPVVNYAGGFVAKPTAPLDDNLVNYDDWARSFVALPPTRLDVTGGDNRRSQFLVGKTDRSNENGTRVVWSSDHGTLNLAASLTEITFAGHAADGVNFFFDADATAGYAGILTGTNLGAPLTQASGTAKWNGLIQTLSPHFKSEFVLEIDFDNSGKKTIEAFVQEAGNTYFHLTGEFDDKGVITGKVNYGTFNAGTRVATGNPTARPDNGILTGLIGAEGAVGAFVSGTGDKNTIVKNSSYSGGFIASETAVSVNVRFNDWTRSFIAVPATAPSTTFQNQFLQGTSNNITATGLGSANDGTGTITPTLLNLSTATYGRDAVTRDRHALGGDAKNGVGFFQGYDTEGERYYYAGIFNGADLGAPLTQTSGDAEWKGRFEVVGNGEFDADFTLDIIFGTDSTVPGSAGKIDGFVVYDSGFSYYLTGTYDRHGVISGDVVFGKFTNNNKDMLDTSMEASTDGTLNGLIGQAGAIGVFHSDKTGSGGYSGGFVACPYDTTTNQCKQ